jgi:NADH:ubiquinone oxidoreductase subunit 6 (subunit J)
MDSGYTILRLVHGWWRWIVLAGAIAVLVRAVIGMQKGTWSKADNRASLIFVSAVDVQFLLGVILYFGFSPFWTATRQSFHAAMHDAVTRFFSIEHGVAALIAVVVVHVGRVRARRASDARKKHRQLLTTTLIFLVLVAWVIPWPWRAMGRPLFRTAL